VTVKSIEELGTGVHVQEHVYRESRKLKEPHCAKIKRKKREPAIVTWDLQDVRILSAGELEKKKVGRRSSVIIQGLSSSQGEISGNSKEGKITSVLEKEDLLSKLSRH